VLSYASVGSNRLDEAKAFYDALLGSAGITPLFEHPSGGRIYGKDGRVTFGVVAPFDGAPATAGNGSMLAFHFTTPDELTAFHNRALGLGAKDEGAPGFRGGSPLFMSYFRDLDGNELCAYFQAQQTRRTTTCIGGATGAHEARESLHHRLRGSRTNPIAGRMVEELDPSRERYTTGPPAT